MKLEVYCNEKQHLKDCKRTIDIFDDEAIQQLIKDDVLPRQILRKWNERNPDARLVENEENLKYFSNAKYRSKKTIFKENLTDLDQLGRFLKEKFLFDYAIIRKENFPQEKLFCIGLDLSNAKNMKITFSNKKLLECLIKQSNQDYPNLSTDATYKVSTQNIPLILSCTVDREYHGHLIAITITASETKEAFSFHLSNIKESLKLIYGHDLSLKFHMSDASLAIRSAVSSLWKEAKICMCFFHFYQKVLNKLKRKDMFIKKTIDPSDMLRFNIEDQIKNPVTNFIKKNIMIIKTLPKKEYQSKFLEIIEPFWKKYCPEFWDYFLEEWTNCRWLAVFY